MIPVFITVRTQSTRLPGKCLLPLGDCNVVEHVIRRCRNFGFRTILCTTLNGPDDILEHIAFGENIEAYRGSNDPQQRWLQCAKMYDIWSFHALDCDDPYFDPLEVERSYSYMTDLSLHCVMPTKSSANNGLGMMGTSISMRKGETKILPERRQESIIRMTLDYEEDYWFLQTLAANGCDYNSTRPSVEAIAGLPLSKINLYRNQDWKRHQCLTHSENTMVTS